MTPQAFWLRVDRTDPDGCWPWLGTRTDKGYGRLRNGDSQLRAHRIAFELAKGKIPDGLLVCHSCDNRLCCNPAHLFAGTHADNHADRDRKGRHASVLTHDDVRLIRSLLHQGARPNDLSARFGISADMIRKIGQRRRWAVVA